VALKASRFPANRVVGQGGMLDSARYRTFIAWETKSSVEDVHAHVLGGHTEATMVPIVSTAHVGGVPLTKLLSKKKIEAVVQRARNGGAEIVGLLKTGSAYYAPAAATVEMVESVLLDKKRILPCAALADGQYEIKGSYVGLPVKLGARGIERIYEPPLWDNEIEGIRRAAGSTKELVGLIQKPKRKAPAKKKATARKRTAAKKTK
jgi:malate dehydrogenase